MVRKAALHIHRKDTPMSCLTMATALLFLNPQEVFIEGRRVANAESTTATPMGKLAVKLSAPFFDYFLHYRRLHILTFCLSTDTNNFITQF